jgi:hypothetical protein
VAIGKTRAVVDPDELGGDEFGENVGDQGER